jgi:hypothetical protein
MINCKIRLKPSKIDIGGVGVFATQKIMKNECPFAEDESRFCFIEHDEFLSMTREMQLLIITFGEHKRGGPTYIDKDLRAPELSMYLNCSKTPNIDIVTMRALRIIEVDEELTTDYRKFPDRR